LIPWREIILAHDADRVAANAIHVLTAGESRATATAIDTSDFADGLTLDQVLTAPVDIADDDLATYAEQRRQRTRRPITLACKLPADPYWTDRGLEAGDRVPGSLHASVMGRRVRCRRCSA
jgi:hypothetical protein